MYYYKQTEFSPYCLYTVGTGQGDEWISESDHDTKEEAAKRVHYLNGGNDEQLQQQIRELKEDQFMLLSNFYDYCDKENKAIFRNKKKVTINGFQKQALEQ